jgi:hypothetical protein
LTKTMLDGMFPTNATVQDSLKNGAGRLTGLVTGDDPKASMGIDEILGLNISGNSNNVSNSLGTLAYAAGAAASALLGIAGHVGSTGMNMVGLMNVGMARFGSTGISGGGTGGGRTSLGLLNPFTNAANGINAEATSGINAVAGTVTRADIPTISAGPSVLGTVADLSFPSKSGSKSILGKIGGGAKGLLNSKIGQQFVASLPMLGAGLGAMVGSEGGLGALLGQGGGLLGGIAGMGALSALGVGTGGMFAAGSIMAGLFGSGATATTAGTGLAGMLGLSTAMTASVVLAPLAAAALIGGYFLNRNAKRRKNEGIRNTAMLEALPALQELLKGVKTDKIDGDEALTRADEIRKQYVEQMGKLDDKKTRNIALKDVSRLDAVISEIKVAAKNQSIRRELDDRIVPTYSTGGVGQGLIRVSQGESLFIPHSEGTFAGHHIAAGNIPNFATGGSYTGVKIRGNFDGKDNILARVPKGTVIANPRQVSKIRQSRGFATGGVAGRTGSSTAQGAVVVQPPQVTAIIVFSPEEAEALGRQIPNSVIVGKVRQHVQKTGTTGLAGDIVNSFG